MLYFGFATPKYKEKLSGCSFEYNPMGSGDYNGIGGESISWRVRGIDEFTFACFEFDGRRIIKDVKPNREYSLNIDLSLEELTSIDYVNNSYFLFELNLINNTFNVIFVMQLLKVKHMVLIFIMEMLINLRQY